MKEIWLLEHICIKNHAIAPWNWYLEVAEQLDQILIRGFDFPLEKCKHNFVHFLDGHVYLTVFKVLMVGDIWSVNLRSFHIFLIL